MIKFSRLFLNNYRVPFRASPFLFLNNRLSYRFSQEKQNNKSQNKQQKRQQQWSISIEDIWQSCKRKSISLWQRLKVKKSINIMLLCALPLILYNLTQQNIEQYAINYFQDDIICNPNYYTDLRVQILVNQLLPSYKVYLQKQSKPYFVDFMRNYTRLNNILAKKSPDTKVTYQYKQNQFIRFSLVTQVSEIISILFIAIFMTKQSGMGSARKNSNNMLQNIMGNKKIFQVITKTSVTFNDVAGLDQSKIQVQQFVDFLKNPQKYKKLGARIPKGVLLSGPPGTGKTMLAKAVAGQAGVAFIPTSGSDFVQIFVGVGASRVRQLFATAREKSPSIIFIDQIDAVGRKRSGSHGSHDERDNTLNQILVQMDGFGTDSNVIVMAATNRQNLLDSALIRPGRFDRLVEVNLPDLEGRRQIFNVHLKKIELQKDKGIDSYARRLASLTPGFSGAEIANLCNEAALLAARNNKKEVSPHDFQMATQRLIGGIEKRSIVSTAQKKIVAVHESGHAVVSWFLQGANPLLKLTIIPRSKGSLGFAQYFNNENKLNTKTQLIDQICFILGGRCAEEHFFGTCTNGAADDLQKAYKIAHSIVTKLGMSEQIGYIGFRDAEYLRTYSNDMGAQIDRQIMNIIKQCTQRTKMMVKKYEDHIKRLSDELFEKQTLTIKQIRRILGERQFKNHDAYQNYLQVENEIKF